MFIIFVMNPLFLFFFLILQTVIYANSIELTMISPKINFRSNKPLVLFKGTIQNATTVMINNIPIPIFNNRFYIKAILNPHQENNFIIEATDANNHKKTITRSIDYFPEQTTSSVAPYSISDIQFEPLLHQWQIKGSAINSKHIYIDGKHIPITADNLFEYHFSPDKFSKTFLSLGGITKDLLLFHHTIGLYEVNNNYTKPIKSLEKTINYLPIELGLLQAYYSMHWQLIPFTTIQEKMIHDLISSKYSQLNLNHIKLLKKGDNLVISLPYLHHSLQIPELSYQLLLILQNTIQKSDYITVLWYNKTPNVIEVVYNKNSSPYCIIDDKPIDLDNAITLDIFSEFREKHFGIQ
tara:strand:+ start:3303 stop:4358 length:1056 start_codon:yes stop_codon:yes gene_type:complete